MSIRATENPMRNYKNVNRGIQKYVGNLELGMPLSDKIKSRIRKHYVGQYFALCKSKYNSSFRHGFLGS